jgi:ubiquinone/menaquinone biosynthesis C-methylase UbiE
MKSTRLLSKTARTPYPPASFDVVYGYYILHLFTEGDRRALLEEGRRVLKDRGYIVQTVVSVKDAAYGQGERLERDTYVHKRARIKHLHRGEPS